MTPCPAHDEYTRFQAWLMGLPQNAQHCGGGCFTREQAGKVMPCLVGEASRNNLSHSIKENV